MGRGGGAWAVAGGVALVCVLLLPHYPPHQAQAHTTTGDEFLVTDADVRSRSLHCTATGLGLSSGAFSIQCTTSPGARLQTLAAPSAFIRYLLRRPSPTNATQLADSKSPLETEHERLALHDLQGARFRNATTSCNVHIHVRQRFADAA